MAELLLPVLLRTAATAIQELSALAGFKNPEYARWSADELRREATELEKEIPE